MKKFFAIVALAAMTLTASAQMSITPRIGIGYAPLTHFGEINGGIQATAGADFNYNLSEKFALSAGVEVRYCESDEINNNKKQFTYFDIPVLAHYNITDKLSLFAGPKFNFAASIKNKNSSSGNSYDCKYAYQSMYVSVPVGIQYDFNSWYMNLSYDIPVSKINKDNIMEEDGSKAFAEGDVKMSGIMLTFGYKINL